MLSRRWDRLVSANLAERRALFREASDKDLAYEPKDGRTPLVKATGSTPPPPARHYYFRSFDRQFAFIDDRVGTYLKAALIETESARQIFFCTLFSMPLGDGPGIIASPATPDLHFFRGSFGGKDVIPLYRDAAATEPNLTAGLLAQLSAAYKFEVKAEDFAAYVYALLGGRSYTQRFWNELEAPGPRVPLTRDGELFARTAQLGRRLIWLHTYAERFSGEDCGDEVPPGAARCLAAVPDNPARYPERFEYRSAGGELIVGEGRFGPVAPEVWDFEVSGLNVVQSWLGYRMRERAGKKSSPLDTIRPERWTPRMTDELLELLWVVEAKLAMEPDLSAALDAVVGGECFTAAELPTPTDAERKPPKSATEHGEQTDLCEATENK